VIFENLPISRAVVNMSAASIQLVIDFVDRKKLLRETPSVTDVNVATHWE